MGRWNAQVQELADKKLDDFFEGVYRCKHCGKPVYCRYCDVPANEKR